MAQRYSKITMAGFISLRLWKRGSGSVRHHVHTWIGLKPTENLWDTLEKIFHSSPTHPASIQDLGEKWMQLWAEINAPMFKSILKQRYGQCMLSSKFFSWLLGTEGVDQKFSFDWFFFIVCWLSIGWEHVKPPNNFMVTENLVARLWIN